MKRSWLPPMVLALALATVWPRLHPLPSSHFLPADTVGRDNFVLTDNGTTEAGMLPNMGASAHSVSLALLPDGRVAAAWFAGSREGAADVAVVMSILDKHAWSEPHAIMQRETVQRDTRRLIRKLGNPVLWTDPAGTLHLWFVSVSCGGWAGSAINHVQSIDGGKTWSAVQRLITSPFLNISTLVRNPPLTLADGGTGLPAYHEFLTKRAEWLRLDKQGRVVDKAEVPATSAMLQPAVVTLDDSHALALMRDAGPDHRIQATQTGDAGDHWQKATATDLPNPDSGLALLRLNDGDLLLAYNPQSSNRTLLALALSHDQGRTWSRPRLVEQGSGADEFSYPALLQDKAGRIHLAYTWQRQKIKHLAFDASWLEQSP